MSETEKAAEIRTDRWSDLWPVNLNGVYTPVPYSPTLRITKGMRVRLPGGGIFQILSVVDDDEGNPGVVTLDLEPVAEDD